MTYRLGMARRYEHVIFDLDGTLIDSRADLATAVNHTVRRFDLPTLSLQRVSTYVGEGARTLVERALGPQHREQLDAALPLFLEHYGAHLLDETHAYPGIAEMLTALTARGVALSVLTNKPVVMSRRILAALGLLDCFVAVIGGDSLPARKPDPVGLRHLCAVTAVPLERTLLVGDSMVDFNTAHAAGVAFCGVAWGFQPDALRAAAERIVAHPGDLLAVVGDN